MTTGHNETVTAEQLTLTARATAELLWARLEDGSREPQSVACARPPWLQGMTVRVEGQRETRYDGVEQIALTTTLASSAINTVFEPVRVGLRLTVPYRETFIERVAETVLAMLHEASQRVPAQRLADAIWLAGLRNPSSPHHAGFTREFSLQCVEIGTRATYGTMKAQHADALLAWLRGWAAQHDVAVPDVSYLPGWVDGSVRLDCAEPSLDTWLEQQLAKVNADDGEI